MDSIVLHVTYTCLPGKAQGFVQALKDAGLQAKVHSEEGCLQYDYHLSCEAADTVVLLEHWRDQAALSRHSAQPHMAEIQALKEGFVTATHVERYE